MAPEPPKASGNGVVRPVCASVFISSGAISPLFSASRARGRNCSLATLYARLRISSCSSVGAKLSMDSFLSLTFFPRTEARDHVSQEVIRRQSYLLCIVLDELSFYQDNELLSHLNRVESFLQLLLKLRCHVRHQACLFSFSFSLRYLSLYVIQ